MAANMDDYEIDDRDYLEFNRTGGDQQRHPAAVINDVMFGICLTAIVCAVIWIACF